MNVLVTGGTGYIGMNLVYHLRESDHEFSVLIRESSRTELLPEGIETARGDITRPDTLNDAFEGVDAIVHLAAVNPGSTNSPVIRSGVDRSIAERVNVDGTHNVLDAAAAAGVDSFVYASTTNAHRDIGGDSEGFYVDTKRRGGDFLVQHDWPFDFAIIHPTYVMGPRDHRLKRYRPFRLAAGNMILVPPLYVPGSINLVHTDTVVRSIIELLRSPDDGRHVLSGPNLNRRKFAKVIATCSNSRSAVIPVPFSGTVVPFAVNVANRLGLVDFTGDRLVLEEHTGTVPRRFENSAPVDHVGWKRTVRDLYDWYEAAGVL